MSRLGGDEAPEGTKKGRLKQIAGANKIAKLSQRDPNYEFPTIFDNFFTTSRSRKCPKSAPKASQISLQSEPNRSTKVSKMDPQSVQNIVEKFPNYKLDERTNWFLKFPESLRNHQVKNILGGDGTGTIQWNLAEMER